MSALRQDVPEDVPPAIPHGGAHERSRTHVLGVRGTLQAARPAGPPPLHSRPGKK